MVYLQGIIFEVNHKFILENRQEVVVTLGKCRQIGCTLSAHQHGHEGRRAHQSFLSQKRSHLVLIHTSLSHPQRHELRLHSAK